MAWHLSVVPGEAVAPYGDGAETTVIGGGTVVVPT
jgi:hypothetical protein